MRALSVLVLVVLAIAPLLAQKERREPLTEKQIDQIAEAGIDPSARIDLYVKFLDEHADSIRGLIKRAKSPARSHRLDDELQDFTALLDELGDNLDLYAGRNADLRKSMKGLNDGVGHWQGVLHDLPSEPGFELALKEAVESSNDLATQAKQVSSEQEAYFKAHPDEKDQDRSEPK
jgi:hypothetical protein